MKIALVRARYNPYGGAERFAARALAALAADRTHPSGVAVLARRWQDVEQEAGDGPAVRLIRCDPFYLGSVWRDASFARAVHRTLAAERFDLVQSHERIAGLPIYRAGDGVHAAWLERRARAGGPSTRLSIALNPHHRYLVATERAMFEHPALRAVIVNSELVRREILERFAIAEAKLVLIRNGVDLARFHPDFARSLRAPERARLGIADDATVFAMVGSGFERKGVGPALRALRDCPEATLVVVGDDKRRDRYEADAARHGVADRVRFTGALVDPLPVYAMADFCLAPTLYDPFPNAVLEALACGLPVVTTDACGVAELLDEDVSGWVVPPDDDLALDVAVKIAVATDPATRATMRIAARHAAEPYSLGMLSTALTTLYLSLLAGR
jgi:UDP-glucose:(heptosyl)LPS alpha-1,3-glucosyltransferase